MKKIEIIKDDRVFIFNDKFKDGFSRCSKEENQAIFNEEYNIVGDVALENLSLYNNLECKKLYLKLMKIGTTIVVAIMNPVETFALSPGTQSSTVDSVCFVVGSVWTGISIFRLADMYYKGYSEYKLQQIATDFLEVIAATVLIPKLPTIFRMLKK